MLNLNEQEIQEIEADANYSIKQLINQINMLQQEVAYLEGENQILKERLENEA